MRTKLAAAGAAVAGLALLGAGGTYAAYTDTETVPVLIEAGTLDLQLSTDEDAELEPLTLSNLVPQPVATNGGFIPSDRFYYVQLTNDGTVPARARWASRGLAELENGCGEPEITARDTSCGRGNKAGELGAQLRLSFSLMSGTDCGGAPGSVPPEYFPPGGDRGFADIKPGGAGPRLVLQPGESRCVRIDVHFPSAPNNNLAQSDSTTFQLSFRLDQA
jgi:predicted ribosomally synthesized peptide with SipW-like signal peptide